MCADIPAHPSLEAARPADADLFSARQNAQGRPALRWIGHGILTLPDDMRGHPLDMLVQFVNGCVRFEREHSTPARPVAVPADGLVEVERALDAHDRAWCMLHEANIDTINKRSAECEATRAAVLDAVARLPGPAGAASGVVGDLRDEVAYWRRDVAARLGFATALLKADRREGRDAEAVIRREAIRGDLAAVRDADAKRWTGACEICGEPVRPGQATASTDDTLVCHARCLGIEGAAAEDGPDDTESDLAACVTAARAALAKDDALFDRPPAAARGPEGTPLLVPAKAYRSGKEAGLRAALSAIDGFEPDHDINTATARRLASSMRERVQARLDAMAEQDDATPDTARQARPEGEVRP